MQSKALYEILRDTPLEHADIETNLETTQPLARTHTQYTVIHHGVSMFRQHRVVHFIQLNYHKFSIMYITSKDTKLLIN